LLGVGIGPGSFTGLRIGIGVAQGLAFSHNIKIIAVPSLEIISLNALDHCQQGSVITVAHDARMSEVYVASFKAELNNGSVNLSLNEEIAVVSPKQFNADYSHQKENIFLGNAFQVYKNDLAEIVSSNNLLSSVLPNAELFVQYLNANKEFLPVIGWDDLSAHYVRNDVAKKSKK